MTQVTSVAGDAKHQVHIRIAGALEPLTITCQSAELSNHLAGLIDGYRRLNSFDDSKPDVWKKTGKISQQN